MEEVIGFFFLMRKRISFQKAEMGAHGLVQLSFLNLKREREVQNDAKQRLQNVKGITKQIK